MKKKKLKKKIKKFERKIQWLNDCERTLALRCDKLYYNDVEIRNDISKLKDSKGCKDDIKEINNRIDGILMDVNYLRTSIQRINVRCDILDRRTQTDYSKVAQQIEETKNEEKTCDTCKWKPLMEQGGQDIPCMGCMANDKKMWKSKEA